MGLIKYLRKICYCCFKDNNKISDSDLDNMLKIWNDNETYCKLEDEKMYYYPEGFEKYHDVDVR